MKTLIFYLVQVIIASGILYGYYHFFLRNKKFHHYNRFYLLAATGISILLPFLQIPVYLSQHQTDSSIVLQTLTVLSTNTGAENISPANPVINPENISLFNWKNLSLVIYFSVAFIFLSRIILSLKRLRQIARNNPVSKLEKIMFVNTAEPGTPFSFFKWLFWNRNIELHSEKGEQIFRHEIFHIEQKHSLDRLYLEIISFLFWINPFFHLVKKEIKAIHEFLADQFAVSENKKWEYAEMLLMRALNTQQHLVNPFFHNQIKRRIAMITTSQKPGSQYLRKLMVLPLAAIIIGLFAFTYRNHEARQGIKLNEKVTVVIDAAHGIRPDGSHDGAMASDGSYEDDIVLAIAKKIKSLNENKNIEILFTREDENLVDLKKRIEFANNRHADLLISLHTNTSRLSDGKMKGFDIYISSKKSDFTAENKILGSILYNYIYQFSPVALVKQREQGIYVIDHNNCPSALVECGYLSNPGDLSFMKDPAGQEKIAESILQSIEAFASQKESPDWEDRIQSVSQPPAEIIFTKNNKTGKLEGTYNGKKIHQVLLYEPGKALSFAMDNGYLLISQEETNKLREQYGNDLNDMIINFPDERPKNKYSKTDTVPKTAWREYKPIKDPDTIVWRKSESKDAPYIIEDRKASWDTINDKPLVVIDGKIIGNLNFAGIDMQMNLINVKVVNVLKGPAAIKKYGKQGKNGVIEIITKNSKISGTLQLKEITIEDQKEIKEVILQDTDNLIFEKTEIPPSFAGGDGKWKAYLERNFKSNIAAENGAPAGHYTVFIQFIVDKDGHIHDIKPLTKFGYGMEDEAIRMIKKGPDWKPAIQNGHIVKAYAKQRFDFIIGAE